MSDDVMSHAADEIPDGIAEDATKGSKEHNLDPAPGAKELTVGHHTGDQKRYVALHCTEGENGKDAVFRDDLVKLVFHKHQRGFRGAAGLSDARVTFCCIYSQ